MQSKSKIFYYETEIPSPIASTTEAGIIKVGDNLTIDEDGRLNAQAGGGGSYTLPTASSTVLGGIKVGANLSIDVDGKLNAEASGGGSETFHFSLLTSDWVSSAVYTDYKFEAYATATGVTSSDLAQVVLDTPSVIKANMAGVLSSAETTNNAIRLFSQAVPTGALTGTYILVKGGSI